MKLSIAFVAALSLVGCATDEPRDPAEGLYGAGVGKVIITDPTQIQIDPIQTRHNDLDEGSIGEVEIKGTCVNCNWAAHIYIRGGVEIVDLIRDDGTYVCNYWDGHNHGNCFNDK